MKGTMLGNYQIMDELGRGGMAVVYRAYQQSLNRYVAIKILPPQLGVDREFVERFQREARAAAGLRHPNIVVVHDVGQDEGIYYIVMELLEGRTLKQLVEQEGRLAPERVVRIVEQVADALDYAHQRGFVHRDVKPSNIFVGPRDRVTLTDFGIAKAVSEAQQLTREGSLMGTPEYMSPEQASGSKVDRRTDLYALGVVLYQMLVGRVPFRGTTPHATLHAVIYDPPPPPRQLNPRITPAVESVIVRSVAKRPEQRYQSGGQMAKALQQALAGESRPAPVAPVAIPPPPRPARTKRPREPEQQRSPALLWVLAALAGLLVVVLGVLLYMVFLQEGGGPTPVPTTAVAIAWKTATPVGGDTAPTPTLQATSAPANTEPPTNTPPAVPTNPPPPTNTSPPPDTSVPPTNTPPPTNTSPPPPTDTPPPTITPTPPCPFDAQGVFAGLWQSYKAQLGCPLHASPKPIQDAEQAFDNGHMFWRQDNDRVYVVYEGGSLNGTYQSPNITWTEGVDPEYSCAASPPPGKVQPKRGFGKVWCSQGGPSAAIGWGLGDEAGFWAGKGDPMVQDFERGVIFRDSDGTTKGKAYVFFADSGTFVRVNY